MAGAVGGLGAIVQAVVPSTQRAGVVADGAEEPAVELGFDAVERIGGERRAGGRAAAALEQHEAAQSGVAGIGGARTAEIEIGCRVAGREAGAGRMAAEEDVLVLGHGARPLDDASMSREKTSGVQLARKGTSVCVL